MDIDRDGYVDILSGSYSRMDGDMAGLFHVLAGQEDGTFLKPTTLEGTDFQPLILPPSEGEDGVIGQICTRPFAVDLNGDGHLDIVSGNFEGTFYMFAGTGKGEFASKATQLMLGEKALKVAHHSDPFFCDWDGDGDQDLLSGTDRGGAFLFQNVGDAKSPEFAKPVTLLEHHEGSKNTVFGDEHIDCPQGSTRVAAADVNGDGKLDLLVGDTQRLNYAAEGVSQADALAGIAKLDAEMEAFNAKLAEGSFEDMSEAEMEEMNSFWKKHYAEREKFIVTKSQGNVWLYLQQ